MLAVLETVVAACTLLVTLAAALELWRGNRIIARLADIGPLEPESAPMVSVVIAARDEERHMERALTSVLCQDYPNYEVIVVDDRSADRTGAILDRMASEDGRLRIVHVTGLPPGWLGKNHALHIGASRASGEFILFSDADVVMDASVLRRAMRYAGEHELDHLAIAPNIVPHGMLFNALLGVFGLLFNLFTRPWEARDPKSAHHIGIGAFNLVRAAAYRGAGGHEPIAMRPDDDIKLGKLIKGRGGRQDLVFGGRLITVDWYDSARAMIRGLTKNMFAGLEYSVPAALAAAAGPVIAGLWPFAALFLTAGPARLLNALVVVLSLAVFIAAVSEMKIPPLCALVLPLAAATFSYVLLRSTVVTLRNDGIDWRGTHYPLAELRANRL
ncbi:MAG TPA: glycosyltransferase family A protein [Bryobacteraceae bacterium]|nr:glycosyltransferase family A protein [Bryobacteraceae bacterium]